MAMQDSKPLLTQFLKSASPEQAYYGDTEGVFSAPPQQSDPAQEIEQRCADMSRSHIDFIKTVTERGVTLFDEYGSEVAYTRDLPLVVEALSATGQRHFGPLLGGPRHI